MDERDERRIEIVRRFYQAEEECIAPDIVWHVPGHNPVSGPYHGRQEYLEVMPARMAPLTRWAFTLQDVMVNGDHVVATVTLAGERKGRQVDLRGAHVVRLDEQGRVAEGWGFVSDQDALDAFFSS
jgi:ketosteroid isomerase-like protein